MRYEQLGRLSGNLTGHIAPLALPAYQAGPSFHCCCVAEMSKILFRKQNSRSCWLSMDETTRASCSAWRAPVLIERVLCCVCVSSNLIGVPVDTVRFMLGILD